jgi:hypothetical protein
MTASEHEGPPLEPSELDKLRFDYAWKWFNFHADQRTKMFNFMLVGLGIFASGVVVAIEKQLLFLAVVLSTAAVMVAIAFRLLDKRNRYLYIVAMDVLVDAEGQWVFGRDGEFKDHKGVSRKFGITRRIALEERSDGAGWSGKRRAFEEGRHRVLMPLVIWGFAALFTIAALYAVYLALHPLDATDQATVAQVVCCPAGTASHQQADKGARAPTLATPTAPSTPDGVAIEGTATLNRRDWWIVVAGLVLAAGGVAAFVTGHRIGGILAIVAGVATSMAPSVSLPLTARFHLDPKIEAKLIERFDLRIEKLIEVVGRTEPALMSARRFSGFLDGGELFDCEASANRQGVADINAGIARARERQLQVVVLLIGGTDRRPLSQTLRRRFESNTGLARARVDAVARCLDITPTTAAGASSRPPELIRLVTGPSYTPASQEAADLMSARMAEDREVRVFVLGLPVRDKR